jgi:class 3 adenylate cyclase
MSSIPPWLYTSSERKLVSILFVVAIFAVLVGLTAMALGHPVQAALTTAVFVGAGVGFFEEFYVQTSRGIWLRSMHPLLSIPIYTVVVMTFVVAAISLSRLLIWPSHELPNLPHLLAIAIPVFTVISVVAVLAMRVVHFLGIGTLFDLILGTYYRPVVESRVLMFIDINESTRLSERLGLLKIRSLISKFLFDISKPITDHGGDIYLYKGDGLIATWTTRDAARNNTLPHALDAIFTATAREEAAYRRNFDVVPTFRIGIHGGDVVVSEQGDDKRSIGIYGEVVNIASRMEDAAKEHGAPCVVSEAVAGMMGRAADCRLIPLGEERVRGISVPVRIYEYRPASAQVTVRGECGTLG